jgi:hypothetical protein
VSCVVVLEVCVAGVYYPYMASIVGKRRGKQTYYYLVESARVQGKPRIVSCPRAVTRSSHYQRGRRWRDRSAAPVGRVPHRLAGYAVS